MLAVLWYLTATKSCDDRIRRVDLPARETVTKNCPLKNLCLMYRLILCNEELKFCLRYSKKDSVLQR